MIDAFGAYGYNGTFYIFGAIQNYSLCLKMIVVANNNRPGPFRKTCELTLSLLRQNEDALMTVLETFLHDPTTDFIGKKVHTHAHSQLPNSQHY